MVNYEYAYLFDQDSVERKLVITTNDGRTLNEDNLLMESFSLSEIGCDNDSLVFGSCIASSISFSVMSSVATLAGKELTVKFVIGGHTENPFVVGKYKVISDTVEKKARKIVACDALYEVLNKDFSSWYDTLLPTASSQKTLYEFRNSFFQAAGLTQESTVLPNDAIVIKKTISAEELSGKSILESICELNACFGGIANDGKFRYIKLGTTANRITNYIDCSYDDYTCEAISKVQIRQEEGDIGVSVGTGTNLYVIDNNFLVYGKEEDELTTIANNVLNNVSGITYKPISLKKKGNPCYEIGDKITVVLEDNTEVTSYILTREIAGIQSLKDYITAKGVEHRTEKITGTAKEIIQLRGKSNVLEKTIDETKQTITDLEEGLTSSITQTANSLTSEIARATGAEGTLQSMIEQTDRRITLSVTELQKEIDGSISTYNVSYEPTLLNYPAWDFTYNIPCNNTVQLRDNLAFQYTDEYYSKNARAVVFNEVTSLSYRFSKGEDGTWYWKDIANTDFGVAMSRIAELQIQADGISADVQELTTTIEDDYITESETQSRINQKADSIEQTVSETYLTKENASSTYETKSNSTSKISQSATEILQTVSTTYQTKSGMSDYYTKTEVGSKISQSATEIKTEVYASVNDTLTSYSTITQTNTSISTAISNYDSQTASKKYSTITQLSDSISLEVTNRNTAISDSAKSLQADYNSKFDLRDTAIEAKVSQVGGDGTGAFGWILQSNGFALLNNGNIVFHCTKDGIYVNGYATSTELNAQKARIDTISSNYISTTNLNAQVAELGYVTASGVDGSITTIDGGKIKTGTVSADRIDAAIMRTSQLTAESIQSKFQSPTAGIMTMGTMRAANLYIYDGGNYRRLILGANNIVTWA